MRYAEYQNARDIAWRVLIEQKIMHLPVNVSSLCLRYESYPLTYDRAEQILKRYGLARNCKGNDGFALRMKERIFIFYNNRCPAGRIRFTLAHELGHVLLGHVQERFPAARDEAAEQQANIFASRLLAPACVLRALEVETPEALMTLCGLSRKAAEVRLVHTEKRLGGRLVTLIVAGKVDAVTSALEHGEKAAEPLGKVYGTNIIANPHPEVLKFFDMAE